MPQSRVLMQQEFKGTIQQPESVLKSPQNICVYNGIMWWHQNSQRAPRPCCHPPPSKWRRHSVTDAQWGAELPTSTQHLKLPGGPVPLSRAVFYSYTEYFHTQVWINIHTHTYIYMPMKSLNLSALSNSFEVRYGAAALLLSSGNGRETAFTPFRKLKQNGCHFILSAH